MHDETVWLGTLQVLGIHVGLTHWTQTALCRWLRDPQEPPLARMPQALLQLMAEPERYCWEICGRPTHHTTPLGVNVATYRVRATQRMGRT